jgi:hypothetical protein
VLFAPMRGEEFDLGPISGTLLMHVEHVRSDNTDYVTLTGIRLTFRPFEARTRLVSKRIVDRVRFAAHLGARSLRAAKYHGCERVERGHVALALLAEAGLELAVGLHPHPGPLTRERLYGSFSGLASPTNETR